MSQQASNDLYEADIVGVLEAIWNAKRIVISFLIGGLLLSGFLISQETSETSSHIPLQIYHKPPFLSDVEVVDDFEFLFKDPDIFKMWKATERKTVLKASDLNQIKIIDGLTFSRSSTSQSVVFTKKGIEIRSTEIALFTDVKAYLTFVEGILTKRYLADAKARLALFNNSSEVFLAKLNSNDTLNTLQFLVGLRLYIESDKEKRPLLVPTNPTEPARLGAAKSVILIVTVLAAGALGIMFALVSASIQRQFEKRQHRIADPS